MSKLIVLCAVSPLFLLSSGCTQIEAAATTQSASKDVSPSGSTSSSTSSSATPTPTPSPSSTPPTQQSPQPKTTSNSCPVPPTPSPMTRQMLNVSVSALGRSTGLDLSVANTQYENNFSLFIMNVAITRFVRATNAGAGGFLQEYDIVNDVANYLVLNQGMYFSVKFSELNFYIGNVGSQNFQNPFDSLVLTSAATRYGGNMMESKACWVVESDGNTGMVNIVCAPRNYGVVTFVTFEALAAESPGMVPGVWQSNYGVHMNVAAGRFCRKNVPTVDGTNPTQGGVLTEYNSVDRYARVVCL